MTHYVYKITNLSPNDERKYYIGVRSTKKKNPEDDITYMGSSNYLKEDIKNYGIDNFQKEILSVWETRQKAVKEEIRLHDLYDVSTNPIYYNMVKQKVDGFDTTGQKDVYIKRSQNEKWLNNTLKNSKKGLNKINNELMKDKQFYDEFIKRSCKALEEFRENNPNPFLGKNHSEETKQKIGDKAKVHQKGKGNSQFGTCWIYNLELESNKKIKKDDLDEWLMKGWIKGRKNFS